jgi:hypothetical protein
MAEPEIISYESARLLSRGVLWSDGQLIGVNQHGHAFYQTSRRGVVAVRPSGVRPEDVGPLHDRLQGV